MSGHLENPFAPPAAVTDALTRGELALLVLPRLEVWRDVVHPVFDAAEGLLLQPVFARSTMMLRVRTGGAMKVITRADPDRFRGLDAAVVWAPYGMDPAIADYLRGRPKPPIVITA